MDVLEGWRAFVEATGACKSRVQVKGLHEAQRVVLSRNRIKEDISGFSFTLSEQQTQELRQLFVRQGENQVEHRDDVQLGFPLLKVCERGTTCFIPLFSYTLPDDALQLSALNLVVPVKQGAEVVPNLWALRQYLEVDIEELGADQHMMGLAAACMGQVHDSFQATFIAFLNWIRQRLDSLKGEMGGAKVVLEKHVTALVSPQVAPDYNTAEQLKDYKALQQQRGRLPALLQRYILQRESASSASDPASMHFPYGLFERKYPLGRGQMHTLMHVAHGASLVAVQGAPGTGKTTLFKSLIANQLVERALACISGCDRNIGLVVTSTARKAVENVIDDLRKDPCIRDRQWLYFQGGDKNRTASELERVGALLKQLDAEQHDGLKQQGLAARILAGKEVIDRSFAHYQKLCQAIDQARLALGNAPQSFGNHLVANQRTIAEQGHTLGLLTAATLDASGYATLQAASREQHARLLIQQRDYEQACEQLARGYGRLSQAPFPRAHYTAWLESALADSVEYHFADYPSGRFGALRAWWRRKRYANAKKHLSGAFGDDVRRFGLSDLSADRLATLAGNRKAMSTTASLQPMLRALREGAADSQRAKAHASLCALITRVEQDLITWRRYQAANSALKQSFPEGDWAQVLRLRFIAEHRVLFELSVDYLWQELLRQKKQLAEVLPLWCNLLAGNKDAGLYAWKDRLETFYRLLTLAYPVMASTLASVHKLAGYRLADLDGYTPYPMSLVDEAGMVSVESLVPLLARSERAVVVGDPLQIEPIRTLAEGSAEALKARFFPDNTQYEAVSPMQVTAYHRAAGTRSGAVDDIGAGIVLDEHRRCQPEIAKLFKDIAGYAGVQVCTDAPAAPIQAACANMGGHNLMFYGVQGSRGNQPGTNPEEVEAIGLLLDKLEEAGYDLTEHVGIITPYANQKRLLIEAYGGRLAHDKSLKIGTVHQFQGVGFEVIVYSPVICRRGDKDGFQNRKPNLLNVAVSRAKQQFIVVGNFQRLVAAGKSLQIMANACAESFFVNMERQSPSFDALRPAGERLYHDCEHIEAFERLLADARRSFVVVAPWIFQGRQHDHPPLRLLAAAQARGVDVKVYYGWKKLDHPEADDGDEGLIKAYRRKLGDDNVIRVPEGTHEKLLLADDRVATVGSWNWLSHCYYQYCATSKAGRSLTLRRELTVELTDPHIIGQLKAHVQADQSGPVADSARTQCP
ncbi:AAA domain-containing protein [Pseudomonas sp. UFMG81]|uniref:AAA domain-containing protein n=1 Tax=Pseudomonas sp. UFMG81 TaxID=2745936 RepID=UPI0018909C1E|nr:AAA domain-containing protein [Pseudomonas sp. UFMG81]